MEKWIDEFVNKLRYKGNSENTIKSYVIAVRQFFKWFSDSYGDTEFKGLYRANVLEYKNYLKNIKIIDEKGNHLNAKSINANLAALVKLNALLQPDNIVVSRGDYIKIQESVVSPTNITKKEVEEFRQRVLQSEGCAALRNYAIVTIIAYAGLRISEVLNLRNVDVDIIGSQLRVADGKGEKQRIVIMNSKIISAIREYKKTDHIESEYLFHNCKGKTLNRTTINKVFTEFSEKNYPLHPHLLRHFFVYNALDNGFTIYEVSSLAGHTNPATTLKYANPNIEVLKRKMENL